jgi:hypothetical protein
MEDGLLVCETNLVSGLTHSERLMSIVDGCFKLAKWKPKDIDVLAAVVGPLIILAIGLYPVRLGFALGAYPWLKANALWLSFPVSSLANMLMAIGFYLNGSWKKQRMMPPISTDEAIEEAEGAMEQTARLNPSG